MPQIPSPPSLEAIRAKKNELLSTAAKYDAMAAKARKQAVDYEVAERVWLELAPADADDGMAARGPTAEEINPSGPVQRKPVGVPAVHEMIIEALGSLRRPAAPNELLIYVRQKYWPGAGSSDIGSTAWRMWKSGRLIRPKAGHYGLPNDNGAPPDQLGAGQDTKLA